MSSNGLHSDDLQELQQEIADLTWQLEEARRLQNDIKCLQLTEELDSLTKRFAEKCAQILELENERKERVECIADFLSVPSRKNDDVNLVLRANLGLLLQEFNDEELEKYHKHIGGLGNGRAEKFRDKVFYCGFFLMFFFKKIVIYPLKKGVDGVQKEVLFLDSDALSHKVALLREAFGVALGETCMKLCSSGGAGHLGRGCPDDSDKDD